MKTKKIDNKKRTFLRDVFPVMSHENGVLVMSSGSVSVCFEIISAVEQETLEALEYVNMNAGIVSAMKSLPPGTVMQKMDIYYEKQSEEQISSEHIFKSKIKEHITQKPLMYHKSYVFIIFPKIDDSNDRVVAKKTNAFSNLFVKSSRIAKSGVDKMMSSKLDVLDGIDQRLSNVPRAITFMDRLKMVIPGFTYKKLSYIEIDMLYKEYLNLSFDETPDGFYNSIANDMSSLSIGPKKLNIISLENQGAEAFDVVANGYDVASPQMFGVTHYLDIPHILITNIMVCDTEEELKKLDTKKRVVGTHSKTEDDYKKLKHMEGFTQTVRAENKQIVRLGMHLMVWDVNDEKRMYAVHEAIAGIRRIQDSVPFVETMDLMTLFFSLAPGNADESFRYILTSADVAVTYTHFLEKTRSSKKGILFADRKKNLIKVDLFDQSLDNQNTIVIGPSGAGKSFATGFLITQRFEEKNTKQIIVDIGGTYKDIVYALVGEKPYYEYSLENPMKFNPFFIEKIDVEYDITHEGEKYYVKSHKYIVNEQKKNFLVALLGVLLLDGDKDFRKEQKAILTEYITLYYQELNEEIHKISEKAAIQGESKHIVYPIPKFIHFYDFVIRYHDKLSQENGLEYQRFKQGQDIIELSTVLKPFAYGDYKNIFDSDEVENLTVHDLIVFDLDRVKDNPVLYRIVAMLVIELAYDLCAFQKNETRKYIYLDEAWKTISGVMGEWISEMFRTIRKRNGGITIITQSSAEIDATGLIGQAIKTNAATKIILRHTDGKVLEYVQRSLGFTDHEISLIESIRSDYNGREIFIKQGDKGRVFYLLTPTEISALLSSKPVEKMLLRRLMKFYENINYALNQYQELVELGVDLSQVQLRHEIQESLYRQ